MEYIPRSKKYRKELSKDKRPRYLKVIVVVVFALNVIFNAAFLYAFCIVGSEPKAQIAAWASFVNVQLLIGYGIKKLDDKDEKKPADPPDIDY